MLSNLKVQTKSLSHKASSIRLMASDMGHFYKKLMYIKHTLDDDVTYRQDVQRSFTQCLQELHQLEGATAMLAQFMLDSVHAYSQAEQRLLTMFDQLDEGTQHEIESPRKATPSIEAPQPRRSFSRATVEHLAGGGGVNKQYTDQDIIDLKKTMQAIFKDYPEVHIPVENSQGKIDATMDYEFDEAIVWFLRNHDAYYRSGYLEFVYDALPEQYRMMVLMHWIELMKEGTRIDRGNLLPEAYFESIPPVPFKDKKLGNITAENKYTSEDALAYFKTYYYPMDALYEINHNNFPEEIKDVHYLQWARFTYGSSKKEEKEEFVFGFFYGLFTSPLKAVMDTIEGIYSVCTNYEQILPFLSFMAAVPFSSEKQQLLAQMIEEAIEEWKLAYNGADPAEKGHMIGSLIGETIMIAIEAGAAVKSVAGIVKFIKNGGFRRTFKQVLKMGTGLKKILKMTPDELLSTVKKAIKLDTGYQFTMLDDEIVHVPFDDLNMTQRKKFDGLVDTHIKRDVIPDRIDGEDVVDWMVDGLEVIDGVEIIDGKVMGKVPIDDFRSIRKNSIHNPDANTVMLGKYEGTVLPNGTTNWSVPGPNSYNVKADNDYVYFDLGSEWDKIKVHYDLSNQEMFDLFNKPFLDDAIQHGKSFTFSHNPQGDLGFLGQEIEYLEFRGYIFDKATMTAIPK